jgi:hypothetical protein
MKPRHSVRTPISISSPVVKIGTNIGIAVEEQGGMEESQPHGTIENGDGWYQKLGREWAGINVAIFIGSENML